MACTIQNEGLLSIDSSKNKFKTIFGITPTIFDQLDNKQHNGVYSSIRTDSAEQDGDRVSIVLLNH